MTISGARKLVREYFNIPRGGPEVDAILCAAVRRGSVAIVKYEDEEALRAKLSSIRALFARSFGLE